MDQNNNGGPAFARPASSIDRESFRAQSGLSTRDYFAAKAMQGLLAAGDGDVLSAEAIAKNAYTIADAMLARREA
jgi:hypothetical protein